jgi:hypothetical protein
VLFLKLPTVIFKSSDAGKPDSRVQKNHVLRSSSTTILGGNTVDIFKYTFDVIININININRMVGPPIVQRSSLCLLRASSVVGAVSPPRQGAQLT